MKGGDTMKKAPLVIIALLLVVTVASSLATLIISNNYPSTITTISQIPLADFGLYTSYYEGEEVFALNYGSLKAGNTKEFTLFLKAKNGTGLYYMSWSVLDLPSYLTLRMFWNGVTEQWDENYRRMWNLDDVVPIVFRMSASSDCPNQNIAFTQIFTLHDNP